MGGSLCGFLHFFAATKIPFLLAVSGDGCELTLDRAFRYDAC
jgi:hypothetical protein